MQALNKELKLMGGDMKSFWNKLVGCLAMKILALWSTGLRICFIKNQTLCFSLQLFSKLKIKSYMRNLDNMYGRNFAF